VKESVVAEVNFPVRKKRRRWPETEEEEGVL
jgi:hypothetical protein